MTPRGEFHLCTYYRTIHSSTHYEILAKEEENCCCPSELSVLPREPMGVCGFATAAAKGRKVKSSWGQYGRADAYCKVTSPLWRMRAGMRRAEESSTLLKVGRQQHPTPLNPVLEERWTLLSLFFYDQSPGIHTIEKFSPPSFRCDVSNSPHSV